MKNFQRHLALALLLATAGGTARATLITIDAGDYSLGTDISTITSGATLSTFTNLGGTGGRFDPVVVIPNRFGADLAPQGFGHADLPGPSDVDWNFHNIRDGAERCLATGECDSELQRFYALHVAFTSPTDFVSVKVHYDASGFDGSLLRAFDSFGNVLSTCRVWGSALDANPRSGLSATLDSPECGTIDRRYDCFFQNCAADYTAFISLPTSDIAYVLWGSEYSDSTGSSISSLQFRSVPEPATFGLLALGGLMAAFARRRHAPG
jgi:hypothetical protein